MSTASWSGRWLEDSPQIFIDLWAHAARFDPAKSNESGFVVMVARRRMIDRLRKVARQPAIEELGERHEAAGEDPAVAAEKYLGELKPEQQQVIRLAVYDGNSHQEIADLLGLPLGTVKTHLRRGLMQIRSSMRKAVR